MASVINTTAERHARMPPCHPNNKSILLWIPIKPGPAVKWNGWAELGLLLNHFVIFLIYGQIMGQWGAVGAVGA